VSWHNPAMRTPHLGELAASGVILEQHYAQPKCAPSRAALLTGEPYHMPGSSVRPTARLLPGDAQLKSAPGNATLLPGDAQLKCSPSRAALITGEQLHNPAVLPSSLVSSITHPAELLSSQKSSTKRALPRSPPNK
jgi:hypothetical protein